MAKEQDDRLLNPEEQTRALMDIPFADLRGQEVNTLMSFRLIWWQPIPLFMCVPIVVSSLTWF